MDVIGEYGLMCNCTHKVARKRIIKSGATNYGMQCVNCGRFENKGIKFFGFSLPTEFADEQIKEKFNERCQEHFRQKQIAADEQREQVRREWRQRYEKYLESPQWESKRQAALKRDRWLCQGCLSRRATQVHHLTYDHLGNELLWELQSVCTECHKIIHPHMRNVEVDWDSFR